MEDKKLAWLLNLLFSQGWLVEVRNAIIYHRPWAAGYEIDPTKFLRSENSCGTLGIRRHEVEPSNLTDGCPAICNEPGHVHTTTWDGGSARRICRQITLFWRPGTAALRPVDINIDDWTDYPFLLSTYTRPFCHVCEKLRSSWNYQAEYRNSFFYFRAFFSYRSI